MRKKSRLNQECEVATGILWFTYYNEQIEKEKSRQKRSIISVLLLFAVMLLLIG